MKLVNLTPHTINIHDEDGTPIIAVPPSGVVARVDPNEVRIGALVADPARGVPVYRVRYGELYFTDNPQPPEKPARIDFTPEEDPVYIVSALVMQYHDRRNFFSPGELIRDADGKPIGCRGLRG